MSRFFVTFIVLIVSLLFLATGVDHVLDSLAAAPSASSFLALDAGGKIIFAYEGDLAPCDRFLHPLREVRHVFPEPAGAVPRA